MSNDFECSACQDRAGRGIKSERDRLQARVNQLEGYETYRTLHALLKKSEARVEELDLKRGKLVERAKAAELDSKIRLREIDRLQDRVVELEKEIVPRVTGSLHPYYDAEFNAGIEAAWVRIRKVLMQTYQIALGNDIIKDLKRPVTEKKP